MQLQSLGQEDPLQKEIATHCSIPAWEIPWTEETDRLQPSGSERVGHDRKKKLITTNGNNSNSAPSTNGGSVLDTPYLGSSSRHPG